MRHKRTQPVSAKPPVKSASCTLRVRKRDGRAAAAAACESHDLPGLELIEKANAPMMLCNWYNAVISRANWDGHSWNFNAVCFFVFCLAPGN